MPPRAMGTVPAWEWRGGSVGVWGRVLDLGLLVVLLSEKYSDDISEGQPSGGGVYGGQG